MTWDPVRTIEIQGHVYPVLCTGIVAAPGADQTIIVATGTLIHRVMGLTAQSVNAAAGSFNLKSNAAGTVKLYPIFPPLKTVAGPFVLPIVETGYFETTSGHALVCDIVTDNVTINVFYISYTP